MAQKMAPMMYVLMLSFGAAFYAFFNPETVMARVVTFIPFTAPAVLPARQAADALTVLEAGGAIIVALMGAALRYPFEEVRTRTREVFADPIFDHDPSLVEAACTPQAAPWVLAATILGSSLAFIDGTAVTVALPAIQSSLGATAVDAQWVVEAYTLFLAALSYIAIQVWLARQRYPLASPQGLG
jgi:hypothetical protein